MQESTMTAETQSILLSARFAGALEKRRKCTLRSSYGRCGTDITVFVMGEGNGGEAMNGQNTADVVRTPTDKEIADLKTELQKRKLPSYPEVNRFIQRKRKDEARQVSFSLAIG